MKVSAEYEPDLFVEPMRRRQEKTKSDRITPVTLCIERKIDRYNPANLALASFLGRTNAANNPPKGKKPYSVKGLGEMAVTYFGTLDFLAAIERQGKRGLFRDFGRDEKLTRDAVTRLKGSFVEYLRDSRTVEAVMAESPSLPLLEPPADPFDMEDDAEFSFAEGNEPQFLKWEDTMVRIGRNALTLEGNNYMYMALDLSSNALLVEERDSIRGHFRAEFGLNLLDRERWQDGKPIKHLMHTTVMKVAENVFFDRPPIFEEPPFQAAFLYPEMEARANVGK